MSHHRCCCGGGDPSVPCAAPLGILQSDGDAPFGCVDAARERIANMVIEVNHSTTIYRRVRDLSFPRRNYEDNEVYEVSGTIEVALATTGTPPFITIAGTYVGGSVTMRAHFERTLLGFTEGADNFEGEDDFERIAPADEVLLSLVQTGGGYATAPGVSWGFGYGTNDPYFADYNQNLLNTSRVRPLVTVEGTRLIEWLNRVPATDDDFCFIGGLPRFIWSPQRGLIIPSTTVCAPQANRVVVNYTGHGSFNYEYENRQDFDTNWYTTQRVAGTQSIAWLPCSATVPLAPLSDPSVETYLNQDPMRRCRGCGQ